MGFIDKRDCLAEIRLDFPREYLLTQEPCCDQVSEIISIPLLEFDLQSNGVLIDKAIDRRTNILMDIAAKTHGDNDREVLVSFRNVLRDVVVENFVERWAQRLLADIPICALQIARFD